MNTALATPQRCILLKNGIQLWVNEPDALRFVKDWQSQEESKVMVVNGQAFSSAEIAGVYSASKMEEYTRRKNGEWFCKKSNWHERGEKCLCVDPNKEAEWQEYRERYYQEHGFYPLKN